ncbi:MAG: hypothetical protein Q8J76_08385 [Desulfobulbaceae bacterium]|nr:hypothetical protein [Desulfobulbaceae bacterium]
MCKRTIERKIVLFSASGATIWLCLQLIFLFGVEKRTMFQIFSDIVGGGASGAAIGILFFLIFGAIGIVSGAIYGALGLFSLMIGGALGGLGLGSIAHILRNPSHYRFNLPVIIVGLLISALLVNWVSGRIGRL